MSFSSASCSRRSHLEVPPRAPFPADLTMLTELLEHGERVDGRALEEPRRLEIRPLQHPGSVEVRLGSTWLVACASVSVSTPRPNRPFEGQVHITTEVSAQASPKFENGRLSNDEIVLARLIEKAVRRSMAIDLESLCISAGKACWLLRVDLHYLNYDGGLVDASCAAAMAALLRCQRPDTTIEGGKVIVHSIEERPPVSVCVLHVPVCVTWHFYAGGMRVLDATAQEQDNAQGSLTLTINSAGEVCQVSKAGFPQVGVDVFGECCERGHAIAKEWTRLIYSVRDEPLGVFGSGAAGAVHAVEVEV